MARLDIGGGIVRRTFTNGDRQMKAGEHLTAAQILAMPTHNRNALIEKKYIETYPRHTPGVDGRFVVDAGFGKFDVIEGSRINATPLAKDDALALAGLEAAAAKPSTKAKPSKRNPRASAKT